MRRPIPDRRLQRRPSVRPNPGPGLLRLRDYLFGDPRFTRERVFLCIWAPLIVVALAGGVAAIWIYGSSSGNAGKNGGAASTGTTVPDDPATAWWTEKEPETRDPATVLNDEGASALRDKDLPLAEAKFRESLKIDPRSAGTWNHLAGTLLLQERPAEALDAAESALSIDSRNPGAHAARSQALRVLGRFDDAVSAAETAVELDPSNPLLTNRLLLIKIQSGNLSAVRSELKSRAGMLSLEGGQIMASAALAASDGDMKLCLAKLNRASRLLDQATRRILLSDPVFTPYLGEILAGTGSAAPKPGN